jgi:hypothetical protein
MVLSRWHLVANAEMLGVVMAPHSLRLMSSRRGHERDMANTASFDMRVNGTDIT